MDYASFIAAKKHTSGDFGFSPTWMPECAFDFQDHIITKAVRKGRIGVFADTGLGKTLIQVAIAENVIRHTNKRVLILTPLAVAFQFIDEANRIAKLNKLGMTFTYADRMDRAKSHAMFVIIAEHHSKGESDEVVARRWNGGPDGDSDPNTEEYWDKVRAIIEANEAKSSGGGK